MRPMTEEKTIPDSEETCEIVPIRTPRKRRRNLGFTLIELLVAIAILGILATIALNEVWGNIDTAEVETTKVKLRQLHNIVEQYYRKNRSLPRDLDELMNVDPRNLNKAWVINEDVLYDAWDNPFEIRVGDRTGEFWIVSFGADGMENGFEADLGMDADLSSIQATRIREPR